MKKIAYLVSAASLISPLLASAQTGIDTRKIQTYSDGIITVINDLLVPALIAVALITFLWSIYKYFIKGGAEAKEREEGRTYAMWSIIGFVVILSIWALVTLLSNVSGLTPGGTAPTAPIFKTP